MRLLTQTLVDEYLRNLSDEDAALYRRSSIIVRDESDTLSETFRLHASIMEVFNTRARAFLGLED